MMEFQKYLIQRFIDWITVPKYLKITLHFATNQRNDYVLPILDFAK